MYSPTRSRRLNEMLGLIVLVAAGLLLLALVTYAPSDPSFNTVGGGAGGRLAHNWTGLVGAYTADLLLQTVGIAIFFVPLALLRIGLAWVRSRRVGSTKVKVAGITLWLIFAPALIALLPGQMRWRHALPIAGIEGTILAGGLIHFVNYPGALLVCGLMVALSLYLTTTFLLANAGAWFTAHFGFLRSVSDRYAAWKSKRRGSSGEDEDFDEAFASKREIAAAMARRQEAGEGEVARNGSLLSSFFGWFGRRKRRQEDESDAGAGRETGVSDEPASVWQTMPRTLVDAAPVTGLHVATAAAAPYAAQLAAAAAPLRGAAESAPVADAESGVVEDDGWLDAPERRTPAPILSMPRASHVAMPEPPPARIPAVRPVQAAELPPMPSPMQDIAAQNIAFGKRADADLRAVAMTPKSVRGYKLPP